MYTIDQNMYSQNILISMENRTWQDVLTIYELSHGLSLERRSIEANCWHVEKNKHLLEEIRCAKSTAHRVVDAYQKSGITKPPKRAGRPRKLNERDMRHLLRKEKATIE